MFQLNLFRQRNEANFLKPGPNRGLPINNALSLDASGNEKYYGINLYSYIQYTCRFVGGPCFVAVYLPQN